MNVKDKIEKLENKFDNFVHDFYDELKDLKEKAKEEYPTAYQRMYKIIRDVKANKMEIIHFSISKDIERELRAGTPPLGVSCLGEYCVCTFMGIPVEIDLTCYNTITATIK